MNLKQRSFLTLKDYTQEEIRYLLDLAHYLKKQKRRKNRKNIRRKEYCSSF